MSMPLEMDQRSLGALLLLLSLVLGGLGLAFYLGGLSWFGKLPGDLRFEGERTKVFIPITSMLLLSLALTLLLQLIRRILP